MDRPIWDKIYKDFQKGGKAWYTLSRGLDADFKDFVEKTGFPITKAFDVGFGTGHYLVWLKTRGFEVAGIDSSETAYKMAVDVLGTKDGLICGSVYEHDIPKNSFDLIFSIHAIHHGRKAEVKRALDRVYDGLIGGGHAYITLPIITSKDEWKTFKKKDEIETGVYAPPEGPEKGLPHSFYDKDEMPELFKRYRKFELKKESRGWYITAQK
jgi:ubiquinone/menaquinone biosynthesis C-methylase UbiE